VSTIVAQYAHDLVQDVVAAAEADNLPAHDAFADRIIAELETAGHTEDWFMAYYRSRGVEISGYAHNQALNTLDLFLVQFRQQPLLVKIGAQDLQAMAKRVLGYVGKVRSGLRKHLEETLEVHDMCTAVEEALSTVSAIRVFLVTNDVATTRRLPAAEGEGIPVTFEVWDITRLHRLETSGILHEPITVEFPEPLPCLSTPQTDETYSVLLTIMRGDILAAVYKEYGSRLLEQNVRSFLQLKGAVNRGIRETLIRSPERFLAYNNGISATASKVELGATPAGAPGIRRIHDFQIVNGGQTTASIHSALVRNEGDLTQVYVQVKLTVVLPDRLTEIAPEISRFSNTQNKVTVVDFSSNDPYHIELEKISRTLWAPAKDGSGQETKWFFERARGQYADALNRERTPARQRAFKTQNPPRQKFTKTDVAKWEHSWAQKPWLVSRGGEKNFRAFMIDHGGRTPTADIGYVQRLIAKGILFKGTDDIVRGERFGGYGANIVTYTIAKLGNATGQRLDLERIWREQGLTAALTEALTEISHLANKVIISPPAGATHVGEWTKREACWSRMQDLDWSVPPALKAELLDLTRARAAETATGRAGLTADEEATITKAAAVPAETWFALSHWARETGNLQNWQRGIAYSLGKLTSRGSDPSIKQATQGLKALDAAAGLGFRP
jgi:hypothetical protein